MINNLDRNVGTQVHPVSWLHERAVALLWDELRRSLFNRQGRLQRQVLHVRTAGGWSGDLCADVGRIDFPDDLTHIGGVIPDIALYNEDNRPIRLIEVVVTSAPDAKKQAKLEALAVRGIEIVIVPVHNENDLLEMCWDHDQYTARWPALDADRRQMENMGRGRYSPEGDEMAAKLVRALTICSPQAKRALLDALRALKASDVDDLFPLSRDNPLRDSLLEAGS